MNKGTALERRQAKRIEEIEDYINRAIGSFDNDPPDSGFQKGYLAAFEDIRDELFKTRAERAAAHVGARR